MSFAQSFPSWFWTGGPSTRVASVPRDARVDLFRGIALIAIFIDHVAGNWLSRVTPSAMGLSDAAEYFVLLAGFSAALAYGAVIDKRGFVTGSAQVVARIWKLYTAHIGLFVFTAVTVAIMAVKFGNPLYFDHVAIVPFFQDPANAIWQIAALVFLPNYLDILPLYIVLLAMAPMLWVLARIAPALALGVSVSLYAAAWSIDFALPNLATGGVWFFNPFAWQLLFTIGLIAGHATLSGIALPRNALLLVLASGVVLLGLVNSAPWAIIPGLENLALPDLWRLDPDKTNLSPWRLAHALSLAYLVARFVPRDAAWMKSAIGRALDDCGRQSLPLFCLGVILSLAGTVALFEISRAWPMQIAVNLVGIGLLLTAGRVLQWYRAATAKEPAPRNAVRDEVKAA
ncbi:OpgC domain-containing protein [Phreatobacter aquaticus]|uniref:OpgC domain-containing protein n=1 Tax=Phreatobacter aquaticus TaxID=2570229 RepID=A0A4D7QIT1_9HYPH|nr:OpgC domain-containing protein [Phreatobacter aquaticus]QCK84302.1 OpgC domain-containing protein [Phreatobacter aquaticus]